MSLGNVHIIRLTNIRKELIDWFPQLKIWSAKYKGSWTAPAKRDFLSLKGSWLNNYIATIGVPIKPTKGYLRLYPTSAYLIRTGTVIFTDSHIIITMTAEGESRYKETINYIIKGYQLPLKNEDIVSFLVYQKLNGYKFLEAKL